MSLPRAFAGRFAGALLALLPLAPASAQDSTDLAWSAKKCAMYAEAWNAALRMQGSAGIGTAFSAQHQAFVASGCVGRRNVCPRSAEELRLADLLTLMAVSEGIAGTFLPFGCEG